MPTPNHKTPPNPIAPIQFSTVDNVEEEKVKEEEEEEEEEQEDEDEDEEEKEADEDEDTDEEFYNDAEDGFNDDNYEDDSNYNANFDDLEDHVFLKPTLNQEFPSPEPSPALSSSNWTSFVLCQLSQIAVIYLKFAILAIVIYAAALWYTIKYGDMDTADSTDKSVVNNGILDDSDTCPASELLA